MKLPLFGFGKSRRDPSLPGWPVGWAVGGALAGALLLVGGLTWVALRVIGADRIKQSGALGGSTLIDVLKLTFGVVGHRRGGRVGDGLPQAEDHRGSRAA